MQCATTHESLDLNSVTGECNIESVLQMVLDRVVFYFRLAISDPVVVFPKVGRRKLKCGTWTTI